MPGKKKGSYPKKKSAQTAQRDYRYRPKEREQIETFLLKHYGRSYVEEHLGPVRKAKRSILDAKLRQMKMKMEQELERNQIEVDEYYEQIDKDYKSLGRPKTEFSDKELRYLIGLQCTAEEIAGAFGVKKSALFKRVKKEYDMTFTEFYEQNSLGAKVSLRRAQFRSALEGSDKMLIFLGKNYLGQKEKLDFSGEVKVNSYVDLVRNLENETGTKEQENEESDT